MIVRRMPSSELYHHGIKGQEWGEQNGPPYPLDSQTSAAVKRSAKKKNFIERARDRRKMKKVRQARVEKQQAQKKKNEDLQAARQKALAEKRERAEIIKTGDAKEIQKIQDKMTAKEFEEALTRVKYTQTLNDYKNLQSQASVQKMQDRLTNVMNVARTVSDVAGSAANVYSSLEKVGLVKKRENKSVIDRLKEKKEKLGLDLDIDDLELAKKEMKNTKRPDDLAILEREAKIAKAQAEIIKSNRIINGTDLQQKGRDIKIDDIRSVMESILDERGL